MLDSLKISISSLASHAASVPDSLKTPAEKLLAPMQGLTAQELVDTIFQWAVDLVGKILAAIVIYFVGRWVIRRIKKFVQRIFVRRNTDPSLASFISSVLSITLNFVLIVIVIGTLGIQTSSFVALLASAGVAIGMALSGTLQNFAGGVMILFLKPFRVGDYIEAQGQSGTVKEIQIFNTVLNTVDNKVITIPNGGLSTGILKNFSSEANRRVDWDISISYGNDVDKAREVLMQLILADSRILDQPAPFIALGGLGDSAVHITVRVWVKSADYWDVFFDMNEKVYKTFEKNGLSFPFPQMDVHVRS